MHINTRNKKVKIKTVHLNFKLIKYVKEMEIINLRKLQCFDSTLAKEVTIIKKKTNMHLCMAYEIKQNSFIYFMVPKAVTVFVFLGRFVLRLYVFISLYRKRKWVMLKHKHFSVQRQESFN